MTTLAPFTAPYNSYTSLAIFFEEMDDLSKTMLEDKDAEKNLYQNFLYNLEEGIPKTSWGGDFEKYMSTMDLQQSQIALDRFQIAQGQLSEMDHAYCKAKEQNNSGMLVVGGAVLMDRFIEALQARVSALMNQEAFSRT
jgi:hypothetical protein